MAYVPNPTDVTQPVESVFASTAAAEFRALKAYIQTLVPAANLGGRFLGFRVFGGASTYNPTIGTNAIIVDAYGGGGGGAGVGNPGAGQKALGTSGGSGAWTRSRLTSGFAGASVVIGAGGLGGVGASAGGVGGTTIFGANVVTAPGGGGGVTSAGTPFANEIFVGSGLGTAMGIGNVFALAGNAALGASGFCAPSQTPHGGAGTPGFLGGSPQITGVNANGASAVSNSGAGGGGCAANGAAGPFNGGNGGSGLLVIWEFT